MADPLLPPRFLFRVAVPCRGHEPLWTPRGVQLGEEHRLLSFAELDGGPTPADIRVAWNDEGLIFNALVWGKRQPAWCRDAQIEESDGLHVWISTRDTSTIHRATRFCHRFVFLPSGGGGRRQDPVAAMLWINRAKEHPKPVAENQLRIRSEQRIDGYLIEAAIEASALTGFDPAEHPKLGFACAIVDRERDDYTFGVGKEFPYEDDPSLWWTLELVRT
ncbi:MAG: hypothetical protein HYS13_00510 [Planctomycetia bacterium]|nr:hypothetical protein [Planctomycetia bacterium]